MMGKTAKRTNLELATRRLFICMHTHTHTALRLFLYLEYISREWGDIGRREWRGRERESPFSTIFQRVSLSKVGINFFEKNATCGTIAWNYFARLTAGIEETRVIRVVFGWSKKKKKITRKRYKTLGTRKFKKIWTRKISQNIFDTFCLSGLSFLIIFKIK